VPTFAKARPNGCPRRPVLPAKVLTRGETTGNLFSPGPLGVRYRNAEALVLTSPNKQLRRKHYLVGAQGLEPWTR